MNKEIIVEVRYFLISLFSGFFLILVYDIFRILRRLLKHNAIAIALQDICYWVFSGMFIFSIMYRYNNGIIRVFSILGIVLGMAVYQYIFSNAVIHIITRFIQLLFAPFMFLCKMLKKVLHFIMTRLKKVQNFFMKYLKKLKEWYIIKRDARNKKRKLLQDKKREEKLVRAKEKEKVKLEKASAKTKAKATAKANAKVKKHVKVNSTEGIKVTKNKEDLRLQADTSKHQDNIERITESEFHNMTKVRNIK